MREKEICLIDYSMGGDSLLLEQEEWECEECGKECFTFGFPKEYLCEECCDNE